MVGVPGRSKACNTCKRRKIACGLDRPQCAQCIKSNRECGGYQRERIFILTRGAAEGNSSTGPTQKAGDETDGGLSVGRKWYDLMPLLTSEQRTRAQSECSQALAKSVPLHVVFRKQLFSQFLHCFFPDSMLALQPWHSTEKTSWLVLIAESPNLTRALETSILALSAAKLGRLHEDPVLVKASLKAYTTGLWELQKALWDPELMYHDETLAACMALSAYEVMECPSKTGNGWTSHFDGSAKLVKLRGAAAHSSILGHQIFRSFRATAINQAVKTGCSTYLSDPEWIELPWKGHTKTSLDQVIDISAALARLLIEGTEIERLEATPSRFYATTELVDRGWKLETKLRQIFKDLEKSHRGPLYWPEFSTEDNPADSVELGKVFPVSYRFAELPIAHTCMLYWTTVILLWAVMSKLYTILLSAVDLNQPACRSDVNSQVEGNGAAEGKDAQLPQPQFDTNRLLPLEPRVDVISASRNICQSLEYFMQDSMKSLGPQVAVIPLMAVLETLPAFPGCKRELDWAKAAFANINRKGMRLMRYLDGEFKYNGPPEPSLDLEPPPSDPQAGESEVRDTWNWSGSDLVPWE